MEIDCREHILLTGAGFTKNFGGPLARELWSLIFSNPILDRASRVRDILRHNFDFESAYNEVLAPWPLLGEDEQGWRDQQQALRTAVRDAYSYIDDKIRAFSNRLEAPNANNIFKVQEFISRFAGSNRRPGFFFTLNQDLFIERHYYNGARPTLPGLPSKDSWFNGNFEKDFREEQCQVPKSVDNDLLGDSGFYYIKLHGSSNWYADDGVTMVIGQAKPVQIAAHPLLTKYYEIFRGALARKRRRLLCVGYSFSDPHINEAIREGTRSGLKLYVLSPEPPDALKKRLDTHQETGAIIWNGLAGYFQFDLKAVFPPDQSNPAERALLERRFFGS